ncbi:HI0074 family nucleotidyltransferase substrate-binding subunit, partial [Klebsiella pneumoniae]
KLRQFAATTDQSEVVRAGVIQAFEFTFELFWKVFQSLALEQGLSTASPKEALKAAFKLELISDETAWLDMLKDRNLTVHTYKEMLANEIYQ